MADTPIQKDEVMALDILREPKALGEVFAESGMFSDTKTAAQAVVKILAGKELGLSPIESMNSLYMVNGKIAVSAKIISSLIKKSGKYDYRIETLTETECTIAFYSLDGSSEVEIGKSTFTFKDAARAGLVNKDNWKNYPRNMLFARALSNGARWYCPDSTSSFYSIDELEGIVPLKEENIVTIDKDGEVSTDG